MNPVRLWLGLLFVALGLFGILDVTGVLAWEASVGQWWPLAVVAFGVAEMATCRRVTLGPAIITAIGVGLLADEQQWASEWVWPLLLAGIGLAILLGVDRHSKPDHQPAEREQARIGSPSEHGPR
jgi:hypothetical protein